MICEDTKYRGGKQLRLICHGCENFVITARLKRSRPSQQHHHHHHQDEEDGKEKEKISRFFIIRSKTRLEHFTHHIIDNKVVRTECTTSATMVRGAKMSHLHTPSYIHANAQLKLSRSGLGNGGVGVCGGGLVGGGGGGGGEVGSISDTSDSEEEEDDEEDEIAGGGGAAKRRRTDPQQQQSSSSTVKV